MTLLTHCCHVSVIIPSIITVLFFLKLHIPPRNEWHHTLKGPSLVQVNVKTLAPQGTVPSLSWLNNPGTAIFFKWFLSNSFSDDQV